jgi:16S rRNA (guanine527-N7)-methyltransferase
MPHDRLAHRHEIGHILKNMEAAGVSVRDDAGSRLAELADSILRWNTAMNLVSRRDTARLVKYHFADSASLLPIISPRRSVRVLDLGGSNGLPGLVLSCICPRLDLTICDGRRKRAGFLEEACGIAGPGSRFEIGRVDDHDFLNRYGESFDLIVARAVTALKHLLRWCLPLMRPGGVLAAYKGSRSAAEVAAAAGYFFSHEGILLGVVGSPLADRINPLRKFAIAVKRN